MLSRKLDSLGRFPGSDDPGHTLYPMDPVISASLSADINHPDNKGLNFSNISHDPSDGSICV